MTYTLPRIVCIKPLVQHIQFYSLYKRVDNRFVRDSVNAYSFDIAVKVFKDRCMAAPLTYSIRPVKLSLSRAQGISRW